MATGKFDLSGGSLPLDFVNTVSRRDSPERRKDNLTGFDDLVAFMRQSGVISQQMAEKLKLAARQYPERAAAMFERAVKLRETLYGIFRAVAANQPASQRDLNSFNEFISHTMPHRWIVRRPQGYDWSWAWGESDSLEPVLWPIVQRAAELLTSDWRDEVRECEADDCAWLFLDQSRNRSRRWCDMSSCGNRAKARRHYQRARV